MRLRPRQALPGKKGSLVKIEPLTDLDAYDLIADVLVDDRDITETNLKRTLKWALDKATEADDLKERIAELEAQLRLWHLAAQRTA
jgi:hypothetical protein